jgi:hypothetical protein
MIILPALARSYKIIHAQFCKNVPLNPWLRFGGKVILLLVFVITLAAEGYANPNRRVTFWEMYNAGRCSNNVSQKGDGSWDFTLETCIPDLPGDDGNNQSFRSFKDHAVFGSGDDFEINWDCTSKVPGFFTGEPDDAQEGFEYKLNEEYWFPYSFYHAQERNANGSKKKYIGRLCRPILDNNATYRAKMDMIYHNGNNQNGRDTSVVLEVNYCSIRNLASNTKRCKWPGEWFNQSTINWNLQRDIRSKPPAKEVVIDGSAIDIRTIYGKFSYPAYLHAAGMLFPELQEGKKTGHECLCTFASGVPFSNLNDVENVNFSDEHIKYLAENCDTANVGYIHKEIADSIIGCVKLPLYPFPPTYYKTLTVPKTLSVPSSDTIVGTGSTFEIPTADLINEYDPNSSTLILSLIFDQPSSTSNVEYSDAVQQRINSVKSAADGSTRGYSLFKVENGSYVLDKDNSVPIKFAGSDYHIITSQSDPGQVCVCKDDMCDVGMTIGCIRRPTPHESGWDFVTRYDYANPGIMAANYAKYLSIAGNRLLVFKDSSTGYITRTDNGYFEADSATGGATAVQVNASKIHDDANPGFSGLLYKQWISVQDEKENNPPCYDSLDEDITKDNICVNDADVVARVDNLHQVGLFDKTVCFAEQVAACKAVCDPPGDEDCENACDADEVGKSAHCVTTECPKHNLYDLMMLLGYPHAETLKTCPLLQTEVDFIKNNVTTPYNSGTGQGLAQVLDYNNNVRYSNYKVFDTDLSEYSQTPFKPGLERDRQDMSTIQTYALVTEPLHDDVYTKYNHLERIYLYDGMDSCLTYQYMRQNIDYLLLGKDLNEILGGKYAIADYASDCVYATAMLDADVVDLIAGGVNLERKGFSTEFKRAGERRGEKYCQFYPPFCGLNCPQALQISEDSKLSELTKRTICPGEFTAAEEGVNTKICLNLEIPDYLNDSKEHPLYRDSNKKLWNGGLELYEEFTCHRIYQTCESDTALGFDWQEQSVVTDRYEGGTISGVSQYCRIASQIPLFNIQLLEDGAEIDKLEITSADDVDAYLDSYITKIKSWVENKAGNHVVRLESYDLANITQSLYWPIDVTPDAGESYLYSSEVGYDPPVLPVTDPAFEPPRVDDLQLFNRAERSCSFDANLYKATPAVTGPYCIDTEVRTQRYPEYVEYLCQQFGANCEKL